MAKYLLDTVEGLDPRRWGEAPMMHASKHGHLDVVRWLVEVCGADVHANDDHALQLAGQQGLREPLRPWTPSAQLVFDVGHGAQKRGMHVPIPARPPPPPPHYGNTARRTMLFLQMHVVHQGRGCGVAALRKIKACSREARRLAQTMEMSAFSLHRSSLSWANVSCSSARAEVMTCWGAPEV